MKYSNGEEVNVGDRVRIVMVCYPMPQPIFLGKVSKIKYLLEVINSVYLERWGAAINMAFIEKVGNQDDDIDMILDESRIFKI